MSKNIILIGGGGHCRSCIDVIELQGRYNIAGIIDTTEKIGDSVLGYKIIASDEDLPRVVKEYGNFLITVGQIKSPENRIRLFEFLKDLGAEFPFIVSPLAHVSKHAKVGEGTIIMHFALVNAGAEIGKNCIINTRALIEHDAVIAGHCHVATGAIVNGGAKIQTGTFFGSNSMLLQDVEIGEHCVVGGGTAFQKMCQLTHTIQEQPSSKIEKRVVIYAKEKDGLAEVVDYLKSHFANVFLFKGRIGDVFPAETESLCPDICISYLSPWIIPQKVLNRVKEFSINFHPGPPEYPGIGCTNFAIYNGENSFGVTAHHMLSGVDSGEIVKVLRFSIEASDSVYSLTQKCYKFILKLFFEVFDYYFKKGVLLKCDEKWKRKPFTRKELNELCIINKDMSDDEITSRVRATNYPNMPGAHIKLSGIKFFAEALPKSMNVGKKVVTEDK